MSASQRFASYRVFSHLNILLNNTKSAHDVNSSRYWGFQTLSNP
jgi:hypothetical protein